MRLRAHVVSLGILAGLVAGCTMKVDVPELKLDTPKINLNTGGGGSLDVAISACRVVVNDGNPVTSGVDATVAVDLGNLLYNVFVFPPLTVEGVNGQFNSRTFSFLKKFTNTGTAEVTLADSVKVTDSKGNKVSCGFSVRVVPANSSQLSCVANAYPGTVEVNQNFDYLVTVSGGQAPYAFGNLTLGAGGTVVSGLSAISSHAASATAKYSGTGVKTVTSTITDANGASITCSKQVTVQSTAVPSVTFTASPATTVAAGNPITLTATATGFAGTPTFTWTENESGVSLSANGNTATVTATDGLAHNFTVKVRAQHGSAFAEYTASLAFTRTLALNCSLSYPSTTKHLINTDIPFTVTSSTGEAVVLTELNGTALAGTSATHSIRFTSSGTKTVTAKARSTSGTPCNNGGSLQTSLFVYKPLSCTMKTNPTWLYEEQTTTVTVSAEIPSDALVQGTAQLSYVQSDGGGFTGWNGDLAANWVFAGYDSWYGFWYYPADIYFFEGWVTDGSGAQVYCNPASFQIYSWWY